MGLEIVLVESSGTAKARIGHRLPTAGPKWMVDTWY